MYNTRRLWILVGAVEVPPEFIEECRAMYSKAEQYLTTEPRPVVDEKERRLQSMADAFRAFGFPEEKVQRFLEEARKMELDDIVKVLLPRTRQAAVFEEAGIEEAMKKVEGDCDDGVHCQYIVTEEELPAMLARGWDARLVLPSGKIVVER